jgi:hypothetical protein
VDGALVGAAGFTVAPNRPDPGRRRENSSEARWQKISESNVVPTNLQLPSVRN